MGFMLKLEDIEEKMTSYFSKPRREITIHTGIGGMELFQEAIEKKLGFERVYMGKKVLRILRINKISIGKSHTGRYFRKIKIK